MSKKNRSTNVVRILSALVPLVLLVFWWLMQANFLMGRALMIAYPGVEVVYNNAWFEWDGDVVAKNVVVMPFDTDDESAIRFERAHVEVQGGWFWYLKNIFDRRLKRARMDRLHLTLDGARSDGGFEPSLGDLGPFGAASASPFEAEGCAADSMWVREELQAMGLQPETTRLEYDYAIEDTTLKTSVVLETPRVSRVRYERRERIGGSGNVLLLDSTPTQVLGERWEVQDQGFVAARNRFCGKKDGIDARRFLDRHVAAIERLQAVLGVQWTADTRTTYKRFARDGGTLVFEGQYTAGLDSEQWDELRDSGEFLGVVNANVSHNGRGQPLNFQRIAARPLDGLEDGEPTFALMLRERRGLPTPETMDASPAAVADATSTAPSAGVATGTSALASAAAPVATTATPPATTTTPPAVAPSEPSAPDVAPTAAAPSATAATTPAVSPRPASTAPAAATVPAPSADTAPVPPAATTPAPAATAAAPAASTAAPATPPPVEASNPLPHLTAAGVPPLSAEAQARIKVRSDAAPPAPAAGPPPGANLEWSQLLGMRGRVVRVWTMHNPPRVVEILATEGNTLRVTARVGGGNAEYTIQREGFLRATLIR